MSLSTISSIVLMEGFLSKKEYAAKADSILIMKLSKHLCLVCSIWHMFFNSSFTDSISALFLSIIRSCNSIKAFFIFFRSLVTRCTPSIKSCSNKSFEMYPLSPKSFPKIRLCKSICLSGSLSSTLPGVRIKSNTSPLSLIIRWSLKP